MSCWMCGHEGERSHHMGCVRAMAPDLTKARAAQLGLIAPLTNTAPSAPDAVEVLKPGTMQTVPEEEIPAGPGETVEQCEFPACDNPKYSTSPRAKWCAAHKDPKNRKE